MKKNPSLRMLGCGAAVALLTSCINVTVPAFGQEARVLYERTVYSDTPASMFGIQPAKALMIPIEGVIARGESGRGQTTPARIQRILRGASHDPSIRAVILRINSPGGTVSDSDLIYHMLKVYSAKTSVPIYAHVDGMGASGGYYVAMAASSINASPTSMVGSIGVIMRGFGFQGLLEKLGIQYRTVQSGENKDMFSPFRDLKPEEQAVLKKQLLFAFEGFLAVVKESRGQRLSEEELRKLADGSVYNAKEAKDARLIDSVMHFDVFIESLKKEKQWPGIRVVTYAADPMRDYNLYDVEDETREPTLMQSVDSAMKLHSAFFYYLWDPPVK
ncbi:MAG: signal peptide peptidase SppA [Spirochaetia bacterium]|nr:signal peptide peptidase SppA [Spirochaetia bacterium]